MRRHDLVYLHREAAFATPCAETGDAHWQAARDWIAAVRPLVAARQPEGSGPVLLGLTLPLALGRKRLSILVEPTCISAVRRPVSARQCISCLPPMQAASLSALDSAIEASGARLGVYGSLAWEALTGEAYRRAESDIDLICDVADRTQYEKALTALARAAVTFPCRLDGELRFPDGSAVAWQEILAIENALDKSVLVKGDQKLALQPLADLLAGLQPKLMAV